ncbi:MAG: hypothetical protein Q7S53_03280 [bacterium]|nr:hypothetical protein [bacterium]
MTEEALTEEETQEVEELFEKDTLVDDPHRESIKLATIELVKMAKDNIALGDLAKTSQQLLKNFRFENLSGKIDINHYLQTVWGRSNNGGASKNK